MCCIEATVSSHQKKAAKDLEKLASLLETFLKEYPERQVRGFWIVKSPPNKAQFEERTRVLGRHKMLRPSDLVIEDIDKFRRRLFSPEDYITKRNDGIFGSVADPLTGSPKYEVEYVPLDLIESTTGQMMSVREIAAATLDGERFLLLGDYGAGKSMTLREIFRKSRAPALKGERHDFPVYLNLREHHGQSSPSEALIRHAEANNFSPTQLLSAWRAGYTTLLLDGFDELGTGRAIGSAKRVRESRRESVSLVRAFVSESPPECGMVVAGRHFYFDDAAERDENLRTKSGFKILSLNEFTDDQVAKYLARNSIAGRVPDWLPSRPLLLGYLAASGMFTESIDIAKDASPGEAWDILLDKICTREADQQRGMLASEIREVLERLASRARTLEEGIGPIEQDLMWEVFEEVTGRKPDERDLVQLNRLPGLGVPLLTESTVLSSTGRYFIDSDFADVARAGDVCRVVLEGKPFFERTALRSRDWKHSLDDLGVSAAAVKIGKHTLKQNGLAYSVEYAAQQQSPHLAWDLARVACVNGQPPAVSAVSIADADFSEIDLEEMNANLSLLEFRSCEIERVVRGDMSTTSHPSFHGCVIEYVVGPPLATDERERIFVNCEIGHMQKLEMTTSSILELPVAAGVRVLLTILKKLYQQRGRGRKQNAFARGLSHDDRKHVAEALKLVARHQLGAQIAGSTGPVWFPNRSSRSRVSQILASPQESTDAVVVDARRIG